MTKAEAKKCVAQHLGRLGATLRFEERRNIAGRLVCVISTPCGTRTIADRFDWDGAVAGLKTIPPRRVLATCLEAESTALTTQASLSIVTGKEKKNAAS